MFKPNIHLRLSAPHGQLAVDQSLIEFFLNAVCWTAYDDTSYGGKTMQLFDVTRENYKSIGYQLSSYLSWFALFRLAQDVKQE